jgi:hypothetical protein
MFNLVDATGSLGSIDWEAVTLKGELAHRASLISTSLSSQLVYVTTPVQLM